MAVNSVLSAGVQGIQYGLNQASKAAGEIAHFGTTKSGTTEGGSDLGDLTTSLVNLNLSEHQVKASAAVIKAADEMVGTLIDIRA